MCPPSELNPAGTRFHLRVSISITVLLPTIVLAPFLHIRGLYMTRIVNPSFLHGKAQPTNRLYMRPKAEVPRLL
jgi:hypothetical protein